MDFFLYNYLQLNNFRGLWISKFKREHWNLKSVLSLISNSIDYNYVIKDNLFNLLEFQSCFPENRAVVP